MVLCFVIGIIYTKYASDYARNYLRLAMTDCLHVFALPNAFHLLLFAARGVRKVTTGITGLWPRSVQSDAAF